jgi:hypothetical protein
MRGMLPCTFDTPLDHAVVLSYAWVCHGLRQVAWMHANMDAGMTRKGWVWRICNSSADLQRLHRLCSRQARAGDPDRAVRRETGQLGCHRQLVRGIQKRRQVI